MNLADEQFAKACHLAGKLFSSGRQDEARDIWGKLVLTDPDQPHPIYCLSAYHAEKHDDATAMLLLMRLVEKHPEHYEGWTQLGHVFRRSQEITASRYAYEQALKAKPDHSLALTGMAGSYVNQGDPKTGLEWARKALVSFSDDCETRRSAVNNLSLLLLEDGQWEEGWKWYSKRAEMVGYHVRDYGKLPRWNGKKVKRLAIHAEQGVGDEILFASCLPDVQKLADELVIECTPRLIETFERSFGCKAFGTHEELLEKAGPLDAWERMGDLPMRFRPTRESCPGTPYIKPDMAKVTGYRARLNTMGPGPYIGFSWSGGTPTTHDAVRRAPRELWRSLINRAPGTKISLQYGDEGDRAPFGLTNWRGINDGIPNLDETIALIAACDVVVTACQSVVHFAGSIGTKCLVITPTRCAWRYTGPDEKMPWYGSVRLLRMEDGKWNPAFDKAERALADLR